MTLASRINEKHNKLALTFDDFEDKWQHHLYNDMDHELWEAFCLALSDMRVPILTRLRVLQHLAAQRMGLDAALVLAYYNEALIRMGYPNRVIGTRLPKRDTW